MNFIIFVILIPVIAGILSSFVGIYFFNPDTVILYLAINIPICSLSTFLWILTSKE